MPRDTKILPGGRYIHQVKGYLANLRDRPGTFGTLAEPDTKLTTERALTGLDDPACRRLIVSANLVKTSEVGLAALARVQEALDTDEPARMAFDQMWVEFSEPVFWLDPEEGIGYADSVQGILLTPARDFGTGKRIEEYNVINAHLFMGHDDKPHTIADLIFGYDLDSRSGLVNVDSLRAANRQWPNDQSLALDEVKAEGYKQAIVEVRRTEEQGAGFYERRVSQAAALVTWVLTYTTLQSIRYVNLQPPQPMTRQQRRAAERAGAKSHTPQPFHLVEVLPSYIEPEDPEEEGRKLAYQTDVRGHYRRESYRRLPERKLKDGTIRPERVVAVRSSWVHPHLKGPKDAPYIPSTYVVED